MTTLLLNALLCLFIFWILMLSYYACCYIRFSLRKMKQEQKNKRSKRLVSEDLDPKASEAYTLVGKSKGFTAGDFPKLPASSKFEVGEDSGNTFAASKTEEALDTKDDEGTSEVPTITEEENEMDVAYTMEMVDEETILREELLISSELPAEVSPSAILARDLIRLERWRKDDDALEAEDANEVQQTLCKIQGTVLMDKYAEHLKAQEDKHQRFLASIRQTEEVIQEQENEAENAFAKPAPLEQEAKSLDYYL